MVSKEDKIEELQSGVERSEQIESDIIKLKCKMQKHAH